ncbi:uncharacterized protein PAC_11597 [Phialocephala subalpina]|uniref:Uncharacterized protein n=1 Tax=Phialocephala subalpina TaxID=576137 RepID=A0A1L7X9K1_9HELO|nr:uncharacterized protein PAC_11597 [Phialocephala subalpina]
MAMASTRDIEKPPDAVNVVGDTSSGDDVLQEPHSTTLHVPSYLQRFNARIEGLSGFEARGITRVLPEERQQPSLASDVQVSILWFSTNVSVNNLAVGLFGPLVFDLGFLDSAMCATFGGLLGSMSTSYMSIWGPLSGNRTMVVLRYFMGYWPSKIPCFLNIVLMVGYCTIDGTIGGQMLSAVSGGSMSIVHGAFHHYERYAWIPQVLVLFILIGSVRPYFNSSLQSIGDARTVAANRLSFSHFAYMCPTPGQRLHLTTMSIIQRNLQNSRSTSLGMVLHRSPGRIGMRSGRARSPVPRVPEFLGANGLLG